MTNLDLDIGICCDKNITFTELNVLRMLLQLQEENNPKPLQKYLTFAKNEFRETLISLQNKKVINQSYKIPAPGEDFDPYAIEFNKNFVKSFHRASLSLGEELFNAYPMWGEIDGKNVQINVISRKFDTQEDAFRAYAKAINHNPDLHNEIIALVKWAAENKILAVSLCNFIIDKRWLALKDLKEGKSSNINFNTIRVL